MDSKPRWKERFSIKPRKSRDSNSPSLSRSNSDISLSPLTRSSTEASQITLSPPPQYTRRIEEDPFDSEQASDQRVSELDIPVTPPPSVEVPSAFDNDPYGETKRTLERYENSLIQLRETLKQIRGSWEAFEFSELETIPNDVDPDKLRQAIYNTLEGFKAKSRNPSKWAKFKGVVESVYRAISPFMKTILVMGVESQMLNPWAVILEGVFLLMVCADRELDRKEEIERELDYISGQLGQLDTVNNLPKLEIPSQNLINCAIDVRSAVMTYLSVQIRHELRHGGILGKVVTTFVAGDGGREAATRALKTSVDHFNAALSHYGHGVGFKTAESVEEIKTLLNSPNLNLTRTPSPLPVENFLVPYEENPHFVGRKELLKSLHQRLRESYPRRYNHRIALHGLGGVGKTQTALAYIYAHKSFYGAIYWIHGATQASVLSSFQDLAKRTGQVISKSDSSPDEVAKIMISWLRGQENWLLIIDNLDDVSAIKGYLPPASATQHTIITTRNPNAREIPAEGMEIGVLDPEDAIELLLVRANLRSNIDPELIQMEASEIVKELGFLALAIEQASAYIREVSRDIFKFLPSYRADRKRHHKRIPKGNWQYSEGVATTWHLSFQQVKENNLRASTLLQLIAFLNPDGILLEFVEAGKDGLSKELEELLEDPDNLYDAVGELERFSLIRREDDKGDSRITIHRLVQAVIKDDMTESEYSSMSQSVISLCDAAFPDNCDKETRAQCRKFQDQVVETLSDMKTMKSTELARVLAKVGKFLYDDGKYKQAEQLQEQTRDILTTLYSTEHPDTLDAMAALGETYQIQKRWEDARALHEKIVTIRKSIAGEKDRDTLRAIGNLAASYRSMGRSEDARVLQEDVLEVTMDEFGMDDPDTLRAMGNLGATYRSLRLLGLASELQEKVLKGRLKVLPEDHPDILRAMVNLAVTYRYLDRLSDAAELEVTVVKARQRSLGLEHPETLSAMGNLSQTRICQRRYEGAAALQETVLCTRIKTQGQEHLDTIWAMMHMANIYMRVERLDDAVRRQKTALELLERVHVEETKTRFSAMRNLLYMYKKQRNWHMAKAIQQKLFELKEIMEDSAEPQMPQGPDTEQVIDSENLIARRVISGESERSLRLEA